MNLESEQLCHRTLQIGKDTVCSEESAGLQEAEWERLLDLGVKLEQDLDSLQLAFVQTGEHSLEDMDGSFEHDAEDSGNENLFVDKMIADIKLQESAQPLHDERCTMKDMCVDGGIRSPEIVTGQRISADFDHYVENLPENGIDQMISPGFENGVEDAGEEGKAASISDDSDDIEQKHSSSVHGLGIKSAATETTMQESFAAETSSDERSMPAGAEQAVSDHCNPSWDRDIVTNNSITNHDELFSVGSNCINDDREEATNIQQTVQDVPEKYDELEVLSSETTSHGSSATDAKLSDMSAEEGVLEEGSSTSDVGDNSDYKTEKLNHLELEEKMASRTICSDVKVSNQIDAAEKIFSIDITTNAREEHPQNDPVEENAVAIPSSCNGSNSVSLESVMAASISGEKEISGKKQGGWAQNISAVEGTAPEGPKIYPWDSADHNHVDGNICGPNHLTSSTYIPSSGNISHRSDSSTTSTRSFAFPVLQTEWNTSPVKMAKADRRRYGRHRGWKPGILCCKF